MNRVKVCRSNGEANTNRNCENKHSLISSGFKLPRRYSIVFEFGELLAKTSSRIIWFGV